MADLTVNTDIITSPAAMEYFGRADRRVMIGMRTALEMLGLPVPEYAKRRPPGRPPSRAIAAAYNADNGNRGIQRPVAAFPTHADREAHLAQRKLANLQARIASRRSDNING